MKQEHIEFLELCGWTDFQDNGIKGFGYEMLAISPNETKGRTEIPDLDQEKEVFECLRLWASATDVRMFSFKKWCANDFHEYEVTITDLSIKGTNGGFGASKGFLAAATEALKQIIQQ